MQGAISAKPHKPSLTAARLAYHLSIGGARSDRQWSRVKAKLRLFEEYSEESKQLARLYGKMQRSSPRSEISLEDVLDCKALLLLLERRSCTGDELLQAIAQALKPAPSLSTIYRWGKQIRCPFGSDRIYTAGDLERWVVKLFSVRKTRKQKDKKNENAA